MMRRVRDAARRQVARLWRAHVRREFPGRLRGEEIEGIDLVLLDAQVAGCVSTWLGSRGPLDPVRLQVLRDSVGECTVVLGALDHETQFAYFTGVRQMAEMVLDAQR